MNLFFVNNQRRTLTILQLHSLLLDGSTRHFPFRLENILGFRQFRSENFELHCEKCKRILRWHFSTFPRNVRRKMNRKKYSLKCWQNTRLWSLNSTKLFVCSPGMLACSCNPATRRLELLDSVRLGVLSSTDSCWSGVRAKHDADMGQPG